MNRWYFDGFRDRDFIAAEPSIMMSPAVLSNDVAGNPQVHAYWPPYETSVVVRLTTDQGERTAQAWVYARVYE